MEAAAPKPPLAIPPHSKLWGFLAFSREAFADPLVDGCNLIILYQCYAHTSCNVSWQS